MKILKSHTVIKSGYGLFQMTLGSMTSVNDFMDGQFDSA